MKATKLERAERGLCHHLWCGRLAAPDRASCEHHLAISRRADEARRDRAGPRKRRYACRVCGRQGRITQTCAREGHTGPRAAV